MSENPSELKYPQRGRGGWGYFPEEGRAILEGQFGATLELPMAAAPNGEPNGTPGEGLKPVTVLWQLQSGEDPVIGNGNLYAEYAIDANKICDLFIRLKIGSSTQLGSPSGDGTSRYVFKFPELLAPKNSGHFGGSTQTWIAGSGQKEFNGDPFFYSQILNSIAVTLGGVPWNVNQPKNLKLGSGTRLSFHIRYPVRQDVV